MRHLIAALAVVALEGLIRGWAVAPLLVEAVVGLWAIDQMNHTPSEE